MDYSKYNRWANIFVAIVILVSIGLALFALGYGGDWFMILMALVNIIGGPICIFFYVREIRKGVFAGTEVDEEEE